jgi:hypothetical protein
MQDQFPNGTPTRISILMPSLPEWSSMEYRVIETIDKKGKAAKQDD